MVCASVCRFEGAFTCLSLKQKGKRMRVYPYINKSNEREKSGWYL